MNLYFCLTWTDDSHLFFTTHFNFIIKLKLFIRSNNPKQNVNCVIVWTELYTTVLLMLKSCHSNFISSSFTTISAVTSFFFIIRKFSLLHFHTQLKFTNDSYRKIQQSNCFWYKITHKCNQNNLNDTLSYSLLTVYTLIILILLIRQL